MQFFYGFDSYFCFLWVLFRCAHATLMPCRPLGRVATIGGRSLHRYLMMPSVCFGMRATSSLEIAKLSAIRDAGFPASHFEIEISSNIGLLKRRINFVGSLPTCSM